MPPPPPPPAPDEIGLIPIHQPLEERREAGRAARRTVPRSTLGDWDPSTADRDPVTVLEQQATTRVPELVPIRHGRMAVSPFAFFRGGAAIMAADLATSPTTGIVVQACGDAHVDNFGKFATPERNIVFDINDFDETVPGPWEWDVKRLCASLRIVADARDLSPRAAHELVTTAARAYRQRMASFAKMRTLDLWYDRIHVDDVIAHFPKSSRPEMRKTVRKAERKGHVRALDRLTTDVDGHLRFTEDPPLMVHLSAAGHDMDEVGPMAEHYRDSLSDERRELFDRFHVVDVARKVVGVGSVGTRCWVLLLEGPDHIDGDRLVLQVKEAQASVLEAHTAPSRLGHQGRRVVVGQRLTQAASDLFLGWTESPISGRTYYVRQLWDVKGQGDVLTMDQRTLTYYGALCAWALARAHARTGDAAQITAYLGSSRRFEESIARFAAAYALTNQRDYRSFLDAISSGRIDAVPDTRHLN
jgi:uncharacterized protein (DUF2252 family)